MNMLMASKITNSSGGKIFNHLHIHECLIILALT